MCQRAARVSRLSTSRPGAPQAHPHPSHTPRAQAIAKLAQAGVRLIAMRCAGFDRVDLAACARHGIRVVRVPTYSPNSVAEHALALLMAVNRCLC